MDDIQEVFFHEVNLMDPFFDSLKDNYNGFKNWFLKKSQEGEKAFILDDDGIQAFLYLKIEEGEDCEITPIFTGQKRLKVGTFKINAHGTKLGERFLKLIFDKMIEEKITKSYVTIFNKHDTLMALLKEYGFNHWGIKNATNEIVLVKDFDLITGNIKKDYPKINLKNNQKIILSIHPKFHTVMFPDSKLYTERDHVIKDMSPTNCIEKIYLSGARNLSDHKNGDIIVIYRTSESGKLAEYNSVITSICTLKDIKDIKDFNSEFEFLEFCKERTIFSKEELKRFWREKKYPYIITMLYNVALNKKIIRKELIEKIGVNRMVRIIAYEITNLQMNKILELGRNDTEFITY